jgi:hypothetical protein
MRSLAIFSKRAIFQVRRLAAYVAVVVAAAALAGCNADRRYIQNGIGDDLYSSDIMQATTNLETYLGFICHQAGIVAPTADDGFPRCRRPMQTTEWTLLVQTGFNDIDRRCDSYLAWLEYVRHRDRFYSSQLNQIGRLTNAILLATSPADAIAIGIVAEAFGYGQSLFTDHQARIMLGYESSTIKTIVSERRVDFRTTFATVEILNKPAAVHVLRSYLRICMPYTITMDANTYARASASGVTGLTRANDPEMVARSLLSKKLLESLPARGAIGDLGKTGGGEGGGPENKPGGDLRTTFEKTKLRKEDLVRVQLHICVTPPDGILGLKTRTAIKLAEYRYDGTEGPNDQLDNQRNVDWLLTSELCDIKQNNRGFQNVFEKYSYPTPNDVDLFQDILKRCYEGKIKPLPAEMIPRQLSDNTRLFIDEVLTKLKEENIFAGIPAKLLSPEAHEAIRTCADDF